MFKRIMNAIRDMANERTEYEKEHFHPYSTLSYCGMKGLDK